MDTFVTHDSALRVWRSAASPPRSRTTRIVLMPSQPLHSKDVDSVLGFLESYHAANTPLHLAAQSRETRARDSRICSHVWGERSTVGYFIRLNNEIFVASPELCFIHLATKLSFPQLIAIGYEFLGTYALDPHEYGGFRLRQPLMTVRSLRAVLDKSSGMHGHKNATRALKYLVQGSASPRETALMILLSLPRNLGGYGLPIPQSNTKVFRTTNRFEKETQKNYRCDLLWPEWGICLEYDSDAHHRSEDAIANDAKKRLGLLHEHVLAISVTRAQINDARELDKIAAFLMKQGGLRIRKEPPDLLTRRYLLRKTVLANYIGP